LPVRKLATLIEWGFIKREGQTYRIAAWMGEADQRRMLNRITAILNHDERFGVAWIIDGFTGSRAVKAD
jgi:hypothetical protein